MVHSDHRESSPRESHQSHTPTSEVVVRTEDLTIRYGNFAAVRNVTLDLLAHQVSAIIGPSGCGKSTLLRAINRMNEFVPGTSVEGRLLYRGRHVYDSDCDPVELRRRIGMVFQKPNPFPKSIFKNVAWGPMINGYRGNIGDLVERSLKQAALWDEVKDKLHDSAYALSGGQQQRLCIARAVALEPDVLLMDEPCSALDPIATARIEDLIDALKKRYTVVLVTHNMQQAARVSDRTAFLYMGELIEVNDTNTIFTKPGNQRTQDYITGRFG
ncbi:MAG: phosphate ABC transporter ATP-binding protein [Planctomycetes bacterium]|nr:phosphate ABC transporter ATP-binding protein [Planctomycetota bacterium]MBI3835744.1 phosphate ABC transporter ATP-binding protein [Planctomycetota bacterium]